MKSILIVDDELPIRELISYNLEKEGYIVKQAATGSAALSIARSQNPELIILDLMLPDMAGLDVCRILKHDKKTSHIPIVMLTAKSEDADIVHGLELGADDYITKPFSPKVLLARLQSVLRRTAIPNEKSQVLEQSKQAPSAQKTIQLHNLSINPEKFEVRVDGNPIIFSATEFSILTFLTQRPGRVFPRQMIINAIKGESYPVTERSIDVQILSIRKKLGASCNIIETIRGVGYRVVE